MYVLKGFIANNLFANNTPGVVAKLGELSTLSNTFAREKGVYIDNTAAPNLVLTSFISKDDATSVAIPQPIANQILAVANYIYNLTLGGATAIDPTIMLENLITTFTGVAEQFASGLMITDGAHTLPEWISWQTDIDATRPSNFIKIWFVDASFQAEYDEYEIYVVPPTDTLDNFFQNGSAVQTMIDANTSVTNTDRIQAAKQGYPETIVRTNTFTYFDPANAAHTIDTDWGILIYGPSGDNVDSIKDALMAFILANSTHTRDQWITILPDIFKRTEFILLPLWTQYSIPNSELQAGLYSQQTNLTGALATIKTIATLYPEAHIDLNAGVMGHPYKSISILSIGSPDNRNNQFKLSDVFPNLISVISTSPDFNRMPLQTQQWASMLADMLVAAESMGQFTTIPQGMMKMVRDNVLYLSKSFNNINYLVVAKSNFPAS